MISVIGTGQEYMAGWAVKRPQLEKGGLSFDGALRESLGTHKGERSREIQTDERKVPYEALERNGIIEYNGVAFVCDYETNSICLGDMSNPGNVLNIPLSDGGSLRVNRDNIDDLAKAIGMFSPEDVNLILRAIAQDAQSSRTLNEIEDQKNRIGEKLEQ